MDERGISACFDTPNGADKARPFAVARTRRDIPGWGFWTPMDRMTPRIWRAYTRKSVSLMVECKWSDAGPDRSLKYLKSRLPEAKAWQTSATGVKDYVTPDGIRVALALVPL